jgi:NTE family protein
VTTAVVLGAGGTVGQAFHLGVLSALADTAGFDARTADVLVGTSAGSLVAGALAAGLSAPDLVAQRLRRPLSHEGAALIARSRTRRLVAPEVEQLPAGRRSLAPEVLLAAARRPWAVRPGAVASGLLPAGRQSTDSIRKGLGRLVDGDWPDRDVRICAVRVRDGRRVVFGTPGAPPVDLGTAVAASCAVPAVFAPVRAGGETYVDGGAHSPSNADVVLADRPDLVLVVSPMSFAGPAGRRADVALRLAVRRYLGNEVRRLRRAGCRVVVVQPTPADLDAMGLDPMRGAGAASIIASAAASTRARLAAQPGLLHG